MAAAARNQFWNALCQEAQADAAQWQVTAFYGFEGRVGFGQYDQLLEYLLGMRVHPSLPRCCSRVNHHG